MDLTLDFEDLTAATSDKKEARDPQTDINVSYSTLYDIPVPANVKNAAEFFLHLKQNNKMDSFLSHFLALRKDMKTYPTYSPTYLPPGFRSVVTTKVADPHKLHFDEWFVKLFGDGLLSFTHINGVVATLVYSNVEGRAQEYTLQTGLLDRTTGMRASNNMQTHDEVHIQRLLDNTYAKTGDINYYIPAVNGDAISQFLSTGEDIDKIRSYHQLAISQTMKKRFLAGTLKSKNAPSVIRFHQILIQTRKIRGENPQSPERSLYTAYPFIPDTAIAQFGTFVMLDFVKKKLNLEVKYYYDLPFSNSLFTVNGYNVVHVVKEKLDREDGCVLYIQKTQLNGAALKAFMNMISRDTKRKLVKMYLPSDDWNDFYNFIEKNRLIPIIGEAPHNGILYLATEEEGKKYALEEQLAALNMIMFCGIELNVGRSFNFLRKTKYTEIITLDRPKYAAVTYANQIMTVVGTFSIKSIGDAVMMIYNAERPQKPEDVEMNTKVAIGSAEYKKIFKAGLSKEEVDMYEFQYDGQKNEVFFQALRDFEPGDDVKAIKEFLSIVFKDVVKGDALNNLFYDGYEAPNKKVKRDGED